jgi:succinate dehydrogenase / fumarate reductase, cytochrome b subunit
MATRERPVSPFMIGPYYRPQLTSVLSILHRATGVFLVVFAKGVVLALLAAAAGPQAWDTFTACAYSPLGKVVGLAIAFALSFHFCNGIRHLFWDIGKGYEIRTVYITGYAVIAGSLLLTLAIAMAALRAGGAA